MDLWKVRTDKWKSGVMVSGDTVRSIISKGIKYKI